MTMADDTRDDPQVIPLKATAGRKKSKLRIIPGFEVARLDLEDNDHLIDGILPKGGLVALYGAPGATKSFWALNAALSVARGVPVHGRDVQKGEVLYICQEGQRNFRRRVAAYCMHHGIYGDDDQIMEQMCNFDLIEDPVDLRSQNSSSLHDIVAGIEENELKPVLIVIDTLARTFGAGNENSPEDMGAFLSTIGRLQAATSATILLIHHCGKDVAAGLRGHSSLLGALDTELKIEKKDAGSLLTVSKMRDGEDGVQFAYRIHQVPLGTTPKGKELTSCVVLGAPVDEVKDKPKVRLGDVELEIIRQIDLLTSEPDCSRTPFGVGWPENPTPRCLRSDVYNRVMKNVCLPGDNVKTKRNGIYKAIDRMAKPGPKWLLGQNEGWIWKL